MLKVIRKIIGGVTVLALAIILWLTVLGVAIGAVNAWVLNGPFVYGWSQVWARWPISLLWALLFGAFLGADRS